MITRRGFSLENLLARKICLNISTWNFPVHVAIMLLAGIFAAGNRAMIKLSEVTPHSAELMAELIPMWLSRCPRPNQRAANQYWLRPKH